MPDPKLSLLEDAARKLAPFLEEIIFVGGVTLGLLITDEAAAPIRGTNDVDVIAEIITYADYIAFSERLRQANFTEDAGEQALTCRWHHCWLQSVPPPSTLLCRHHVQSYGSSPCTPALL